MSAYAHNVTGSQSCLWSLTTRTGAYGTAPASILFISTTASGAHNHCTTWRKTFHLYQWQWPLSAYVLHSASKP